MTTSHRGSSQTTPGRGPYIGRPMPRYEDLRLVRGQGRYTDDLSLPGQGYAVFVRAPHAHARILRIDTAAARAMPGVVAVLTGQDYVDDGFIGMPHFPNPAGAIDIKVPSFTSTPECAILDEPQLPFAVDLVRFVGEAVAIVVAESLPAARDGAEAVVVEYEALPAVTDVFEALAPGAPAIWPQAPGNLALDNAFGDRAAVDAAMAKAHLVVEETIRCQRTASGFMEPRAALGAYDAAEKKYTLMSGCQGVHRIRHPLAVCLKEPQENVHVICPDVGGGFGSRTNLYPGAGRRGVGGAPRRPSGEVDRRPHRGVPHRLQRARCRDQGAARLQQARPHPGDGPRAHRQHRRAHGVVRAAEQRLPRRPDGLRRARSRMCGCAPP